jgi:hypothetical protein
VVSNASNINSVAGNSTNINSVAGSITNVNTVASNLASVNNFADVYRIASSAPTTSLDVGDLYFDTTSDTLKVYGASGWQSAGSSINGTSQRYHYDITGTPTSVTGADANGNTLTYDAGYVDVYVNGVRMSDADITVTSGDTVTFTEALANGDEVDIVGYGTFSVASLNADNLDSGTVPDARITGAYTGITNLTMSGNLTVDTNTLVVDSSNNRVGINTTGSVRDLQIGDNTRSASILSLQTNSTGNGSIYFGDNTTTNAEYAGMIRYSHSDNAMLFWTSSTERMRIDSSGNLLVGKTNQTANVAGTEIEGSGTIVSTRDNNTNMFLNRKTSDGNLIEFRKDNIGVGSIGYVSTGQYIQGETDHSGIRFGGNQLIPFRNGSDTDATTDLGASGVRYRNLYLSGGVYLGGTGSANLLDDYEEGTWTPTVSQGTVTSVRSSYIKIGKRVTISAELNTFSNRTNSGSIEIQSLPFTQDTAKDRVCIGTAMWQYVDQENNAVFNATNGLQFYKSQSGAFDSLRYNDLNNSLTTVYFFATYVTT